MNTIVIDGENVNLNGFEELTDVAYFIFRKNGVVISKDVSDGIFLPQIKYNLKDGSIKDKNLAEKLSKRGFDMENTFIYTEGCYISNNPLDDVV